LRFIEAVGGFLMFFGGIGWVTIIWTTASERGGWVSWAMVAAFPVGALVLYLVHLWENPK